MERDELIRSDFPLAHGETGFDRASVTAHLIAVAAEVAALESRIAALEVERGALWRRLEQVDPEEAPVGSQAAPFTRTAPPPAPAARLAVFPEDGHRAAAGFGRAARRETPPSPEDAPPSGGGTGPAAGEPEAVSGDEVAARLAASTLVLEGADREAIRRKLDSDFQLSDPEGLLEDVLARLA